MARLVLTGAFLAVTSVAVTVGVGAWLSSPQASGWAGLAAVVPVVAAVIIGVGLGAWLTRVIRGPVLRMVDHVKTQGYLAAEGVPYPGDDLADDRTLPIEFRELGAVVEDLLRHLNARQAELKQAIREAEYAEETLGVVVTESAEAKIVLQDGRIVIANPAAASALGLPVSQLTDLTVAEAMHGIEIRDEQGTRYDATGLLERAMTEQVTVSMTEPGRPERWYIAEAIRHAGDLHNRILFTARDVTEERRLASIRAEVVSLISHDLRSPLTVVIGYLDLLSRPMPPVEFARALEAARRNAARMADLLEDLLSATRAQELLAPSELVPTPLFELADEVVSSLAPTHAERKLLLEADCDPVVLGEEKRLRQVLVNLVTNAYKYSPDTDPILVRVHCDDENAYLEVVDHGPGVPEEERDRAFERFERLENGAGRPGVGLGLYIVNIIAHNHGGSARVEETPGGGATFVVQLPLAGEMVDGEIVLRERPAPETA
jgi:signal transduction histidine kinase